MSESNPNDVTLHTLHADLTAGFADVRAEMHAGFADVKTTLIAGFRGLASRESAEEIVRLLREANRLNEKRFTLVYTTRVERRFDHERRGAVPTFVRIGLPAGTGVSKMS